MGIKSITTEVAGQVGDKPRRVMIVTTDNLATVTAAGYLNRKNLLGYNIYSTDIIDMWYDYVNPANSGTFSMFTPAISASGVITLTLWGNPGDVLLPVVNNHFAVFNGITGQIKDMGFSPTESNRTQVVMLNTAPATVNNFAKFSSLTGTITDAGARIIANTTGSFGGGGTSNTFTALGLTSAAKGSAVIRTSTNAVAIAKALPGTDTLAITFTGDPGAGTTVDYIYSTATMG